MMPLRRRRNSEKSSCYDPYNSSSSLQMFIAQSSGVEQISIDTLNLLPSNSRQKLTETVRSNLKDYYMFAKLFDGYTANNNFFDMSVNALQCLEAFSSKFSAILESLGLTINKLQEKLTNWVNCQTITETNVFKCLCQQLIISQQRVIQSLFEAELSTTEDKEIVEKVLKWNDMEIIYSYIYWKRSDLFAEASKAEYRKLPDKSIMSCFKRFKQFLYSANNIFSAERKNYESLKSVFESFQSYTIESYEIFMKKVERLPGISRKYIEIFETIRNMNKEFLSQEFFATRSILDAKRKIRQVYSNVNNAVETFRVLENQMEALYCKDSKKLYCDRTNSPFDFSNISHDPSISLSKLIQKKHTKVEGESEYENEDSDRKSFSVNSEITNVIPREQKEIRLFEEFKETEVYKELTAIKALDNKIDKYMKTSPDNPERTDLPYLYDNKTNIELNIPRHKNDVRDYNSKSDEEDKSRLLEILEEADNFQASSLDLTNKSQKRLLNIHNKRKQLEELLIFPRKKERGKTFTCIRYKNEFNNNNPYIV